MAEKQQWANQIFQVVCVVHDLNRTLENWKRMVEFDQSSIKLGTTAPDAKCRYRGQEISCPVRYARFDLGGIDMKLVEPLNKTGGDPYSDTLQSKGQGFHHIGIYVQDRDSLIARYQAMGITPVYEEIDSEKQYLLYDFCREIGMVIAPWSQMVGPCGGRDPQGKTK